eukprot:3319167-Rhodomonas_salina.1
MLQHRKLLPSLCSAPLRAGARVWGDVANADSPQRHRSQLQFRNISQTCWVAKPAKMEASFRRFRPVQAAAPTAQWHAQGFGFPLKHSQRILGVGPCVVPARGMVITVELSETEFHNMANVILDEVQDQLEAQEDANPGLEVESSGVRFRKRLTVFGNLFFCATCVCVVFAVYIHDESGSRQLDGVINIKIAGTGHWVINKQTPSRQIWVSSPVTYVPPRPIPRPMLHHDPTIRISTTAWLLFP